MVAVSGDVDPDREGGIRVLHVDDDPSVLELTAAFLDRELDEPRVESAASPDEGLEAVEERSYDCIVSDYEMPGMDGLAFFEAIREVDPAVPFVLYTGKGSEEIASRALNAGVTGYFQKGGPDQQRRLANRIERAAEEYRARVDADRYSTVLEALGYPVYVLDEAGHFEYVNEPFLELTGYDREDVLGSPPDLIKDEAAVRAAEAELASVLSDEGPDTSQFAVDVVPKDGEPIPCRDHMAALPYEGERFRGSVGILRDVSDERRRQRELETRTQALEAAPIGITITEGAERDYPIVYANDGFVELTGYDREDVLGRNCRFLQGPETREEPVRELREALEAEESAAVTLRNYREDGEPFWNRVTVAPLRNDDGAVTHYVGFQEEVTERIEAERALKRQNERLESFAGVVSHDLRNPLGIAQGNLELAREDRDSDPLDRIGDALDRMEAIVEDTLTLAREGESVGDVDWVPFVEVATDCWGTVETGSLSLETGPEFRISADASRLRSLLENLFRNAVEHGSTSPRSQPREDAVDGAGEATTVRVGPLEDGFYVEDDGPGIPEDRREEVFQPGASTAPDGAGFGLAIVKEIAEAHGWSVAVTDGADGGARFEIIGVEVRDVEG